MAPMAMRACFTDVMLLCDEINDINDAPLHEVRRAMPAEICVMALDDQVLFSEQFLCHAPLCNKSVNIRPVQITNRRHISCLRFSYHRVLVLVGLLAYCTIVSSRIALQSRRETPTHASAWLVLDQVSNSERKSVV